MSYDDKHVILIIKFRPDEEELLLHIPEESIPVWKKRYGRIGQLFSEMGKLIQRKRWPHFMQEQGIIWTHIYPVSDVIEHAIDNNSLCKCAPRVDVVNKKITHYPMDPGISEYFQGNGEWNVVSI